MLRNGNKYLLMLVSIIMLTACISQSKNIIYTATGSRIFTRRATVAA